jgi:hypothetical protein
MPAAFNAVRFRIKPGREYADQVWPFCFAPVAIHS